MERRNFLPGLLAAPLALKAGVFARARSVGICGAPMFRHFVPGTVEPDRRPCHNQAIRPRRRQVVQLLAEGKSLKDVAGIFGLAAL